MSLNARIPANGSRPPQSVHMYNKKLGTQCWVRGAAANENELTVSRKPYWIASLLGGAVSLLFSHHDIPTAAATFFATQSATLFFTHLTVRAYIDWRSRQ